MRKTAILLLSVLVAASVSAQSLAELAKKEKKRREETRAEGRVAKEYNDETMVTGEPASEEDDDDESPRSADENTSTSSNAPEDSIEWKGIYGRYKVRYLHLENLMGMLDEREAKWCTPKPSGSERADWGDEMAKRREECQKVRGEQTELRGEMRAMQSDCLADAKKFGVLPGQARLGR